MNVPYSVALRRLQGVLIGPDGRQTCVVVTLADEAIGEFRDVLGRGGDGWLQIQRRPGVLFQALQACGIELDKVHLGGPPVDNVAIDEEGERTLLRLAGVVAERVLLPALLAGPLGRVFRPRSKRKALPPSAGEAVMAEAR